MKYRGHKVINSITSSAATLAALVYITCVSTLSSAANAQLFSNPLPVSDVLKNAIESPTEANPRSADAAVLSAFYAARNFQPVWVDANGPTRAAQMVLEELNDAPSWGLTAKDFALTANKVPQSNGRWTPEQTAAAELEISQAVINYAQQARGARIAEPDTMLSTYLDRRPTLPNSADVLASVATSDRPDELLRGFHPSHQQFQKLRDAYAQMSSADQKDPASVIPEDGKLLVPGTRDADVIALRKRFNIAAADTDADLYDDAIAAAVARFQDSVNLRSDGYVGPKTRKALNTGNATKLATIRANMEQWRWMPADLGARHLLVNIPAFKVSLMQDGEVAMAERVIVGREDTQTPIFSKNLSTIVLRPSWQLPESIKLEKLLSSQRRGTHIENQGYVIRKGKRIIQSWTINWSKAKLSDYEIFQPSGDGNALGDVKFLFPNKHAVYLHDTPSKSLFDASERLFSHGCIRLKNPLVLAQTLLDADKGENAVDVKYQVRRGPGSNAITLDRTIPVHVGYFTAWAEDDGVIRLYNDPYSHEQRIKLALDNKWKLIDKGEDHLAAVDTVQLKTVRIVQRPTTAARRRYAAPFGVTKAKTGPSFFKSYSSKSDRDSVGELMRSALGNR